MIAFIKGPVSECLPTHVIVEAAGVGYLAHISLNTYARINGQKEIKLLTHLITREDGQSLYGFAQDEERQLFIHLISVSGVGPNTARIILSSLEPAAVRQAIIAGDDGSFKRVKGIGPKTAQRIIVDLKDKLVKDMGFTPVTMDPYKPNLRTEAQAALMALGFARPQVETAIQKIRQEQLEGMDLEQIIKEALKNLA
jgi:Holliday junction DNA helicase RuvA